MKKTIITLLMTICLLATLAICLIACTAPKIKLADAQEIAFNETTTPEGTALKDAGYTIDQIKFISTESDWENGIKYFDIEFVVDGVKYEYDINATSGEIVCKEIDDKLIVDESVFIGADAAMQKALEHAGITGEVSYSTKDLDFDDGKYVYEIEFYFDKYEYEYVIDATTGKVLEHEKDR